MRMETILTALLALALGMGAANAQDITEPTVRQSYQICEWGLLVIEHPLERAPFVDIIEPGDFTGVASLFTVAGEGAGLFEGNVVVEVRDIDGNVLFMEPTIAAANELGGRGPWSITVDLGDIPEATRIVVSAYTTSPEDGEIVAQDTVSLSANSQFGLPYIDVTSPISGDPAATSPLHVEGTAGALFENNFVLEVTDVEGNVLAQTPVTFAAPDIGLAGPWAADLDVDAEPGDRLIVTAYALSMADGETIVASDTSIVTADLFDLRFDQTLIVQAGDPITMDDDICSAVAGEFANADVSPVHVTALDAISTLSMPPQTTLIVSAEGPSVCQMPLRLRLTRTGDSYAGELYYSTADGGGACTRDIRPFTIYVPLGTQPDGVFTAEINGVSLGIE